MDEFREAVARCLQQIPAGRVTTCGAVAEALGDIRAARAVATWLLDHPTTPGGHRIIRADGRPILPDAIERFATDGVRFRRGRVPSNRLVKSLKAVGFLEELRDEQRRLASRVMEEDEASPERCIAGVDVAYEADRMFAAAVCVDARDLRVIEVAEVTRAVSFPYIPTYLAYREFPGIEAAIRRLSERPDVLMIDGHGRLHPALFGLACDAGVRLDLPTIGVAKHPLAGRVSKTSPRRDGAIPIELEGRTRGYAWTPPGRGRSIFISVGHRISLERALETVRRTTPRGYPIPLKLADRSCREMKRNEKK